MTLAIPLGIYLQLISYPCHLKLSLRSKVKSEALGLTEVDVVMDQAIYAKAVEKMLHPTHADLANFVILRMGSFHTALNFMSVIGKRFSNSGEGVGC